MDNVIEILGKFLQWKRDISPDLCEPSMDFLLTELNIL